MTSDVHEQYRDAIVDFTNAGVVWSTTWEDAALVDAALELGAGDRLLMVAGAGCNVFSALLHEPARVVAVDINPAQIALVELRLAAIRGLDHAAFLRFMGIEASSDRVAVYEQLRASLPAPAQTFWDAHHADLERGLLYAGRVEQMFAEFPREWSRIQSRETIDRLFSFGDDVAAQARYFTDVIATPALRDVARRVFGLAHRRQARLVIPVMARCFGGREDAFDDMWWAMIQRACTTMPLARNPYMQLMLTGAYRSLAHAPPYLHATSYPVLQAMVSRVACVIAPIEDVVRDRAAHYTKANLSNVFLNFQDAAKETLSADLVERMSSGGRYCYLDRFVASGPARRHLRSLDALAAELAARDRLTFSGQLHIEERLSS
jgi:S-adenosylmethionine-diacylglycerol 3-amino-3-carboxypropyl transferase